MIIVDTSALLAIILGEPEEDSFTDILLLQDCAIGSATLLEAHMTLARHENEDLYRSLDFLIDRPNIEQIPFEAQHLVIAKRAFDFFGKGRSHPARLNFGDCMAYAIAKVADAPLLFKGDDFVHTDIRPAIAV